MINGDNLETTNQTRIAVLGTLAEFHQEPLPYDLQALVKLVADINPDLLCLDITLEQWQQQDFSRLPQEYSQALLPLTAQTDIVVVPIGGEQEMPKAAASGWRGIMITWARKLLNRVQSGAPGPDAINQGWRHDLGNTLYSLARRLSGKSVDQAYHAHIDQVSRAALEAARNNPGNRILVVTNIQYCHHIRPLLQQQPGLIEIAYQDL